MIVPSLVQVYALHLRNKMVTDAIEYVWIHFYWLNKNVFLLQAISSIANLFKPEVSVLSTSMGVNYSPLKFVGNGLPEEQHLLEKATMALMSSLNSEEDSLPYDDLDILVSFKGYLICTMSFIDHEFDHSFFTFICYLHFRVPVPSTSVIVLMIKLVPLIKLGPLIIWIKC